MALEAAGAVWTARFPEFLHQLLKGNFGDLDELLCSAEVPGVDGFLFDLGVSSPQLDIPGRAFRITRTPHWTCGWIRVITP